MKNRRERAKQVRQRKVAALAAYSRQHTVRNCTIPEIKKGGTGEWKEEKHPQPKRMFHSYKKRYSHWKAFYQALSEPKTPLIHSSDYKIFENRIKDISKHVKASVHTAWYQEQLVQYKLAKWERKNPCPVKADKSHPDMFEQEFVIPWRKKRDEAIQRIRDFVVSMYDKLPLTGRFEQPGDKYVEEKVAEIKDVNMEGHIVNKLDPKKSKLLKNAQKKTDQVKAKRTNLVCTNLKDHMRQKGRIILPKAA